MSTKNSREITVEKSPDDPQERRRLYNKAVREAALVTILLSKVDFAVNRNMARPDISKLAGSIRYGGKLIEFAFDSEKQVCAARIEWKVEIKSGRQNFAKCVAQYDVIYDGFEGASEEIIKLFAENVSQPATYAYFRSLFASLDWSSDLNLPPLPIVKFHPKV